MLFSRLNGFNAFLMLIPKKLIMKKNKLILPVFSLLLLFLFVQCSTNEQNNEINTPPPNNEPNIETNIIPDNFSFSYEQLQAMPREDLNKETIPEWLVNKINEYEKSIDPVDCMKFFRGKWNNRIVYLIYNSFSSCLLCKLYYEDGSKVILYFEDDPYLSNELLTDFLEKSTNWVIFNEFGSCL